MTGRQRIRRQLLRVFGALAGCLWIASIGAALVQAAGLRQSVPVSSASASQYRALLNRYCVTCHNEQLKTAGLMLDKFALENIPAGAPVWESVVRKLRARAMPPAGMPRPDAAQYDSFAAYLESALDGDARANPNPGRPTIHRLNRAEYTNAIRDLLAVDIDSRSLLPADDSGEGFDNIADSLSISPTLMERYIGAARKISRLAVGDSKALPSSETYDVPRFLQQDDRVSDDLPFASRGGIAIRYNFPADGEYSVKIRLVKDTRNFLIGLNEGLGEPHQLDIRVDGERRKVLRVGGEREGRERTVKSPPTNYEGDPDIVKYETIMDDALEARFSVMAGTRMLGVSFVRPAKAEGILRPLPLDDVLSQSPGYKDGNPAVASVTVSGPFDAKGVGNTASRQKVFLCHPKLAKQENLCAQKIITVLAQHAYRRPITEADLKPLFSLYKTGRDSGGFEDGIAMALQGILISPKFLFRIEADPPNAVPGGVHPVSDIELASRLSFFLWSSIPDDELLHVVEIGKLTDRSVLEQQARRMLSDSRSEALIANFAGQWLLLRNLEKVVPDRDIFPNFDDSLRQAFQEETRLFLESMIREDRSVLELLNADYTFVNDRLARFYQIPDIHGSSFRRVQLTDENRRGLLGQASILTVTSYATRTSPTLRGKWLLENIFGAPPPPPPPNVPSLKDRGADGKILSVREQMEKHRASPVCASCHARMDPLGFALENFDAVGKWQTSSDNVPIDSSGVLPDGTKFQGPAELRKLLLNHPEEFATTVTEKLLTYALGRGIEYYDEPAVRKIVREAAPGGYRWGSIILGVINSTPFQMRAVVATAPVTTTTAQAENRSPQP